MKTKGNPMTVQQLEIGFDHAPVPQRRSGRRLSRAQWWFHRMRQVVNQALDWHSAPAPRPEQIYLALAKSR